MTTACAYNPVIDTAGRSGTYDEDKAREITNDVQHCRELADEHTIRVWDTWSQAVNIYVSTATLGIIPKKDSAYKTRVKNCLEGRGHSVIK
jgi:hypothetical protein